MSTEDIDGRGKQNRPDWTLALQIAFIRLFESGSDLKTPRETVLSKSKEEIQKPPVLTDLSETK